MKQAKFSDLVGMKLILAALVEHDNRNDWYEVMLFTDDSGRMWEVVGEFEGTVWDLGVATLDRGMLDDLKILDDSHGVIPATLTQWLEWWSDDSFSRKTVGYDHVPGPHGSWRKSTIHTVFYKNGTFRTEINAYPKQTYSTWDDALRGHETWVARRNKEENNVVSNT